MKYLLPIFLLLTQSCSNHCENKAQLCYRGAPTSIKATVYDTDMSGVTLPESVEVSLVRGKCFTVFSCKDCVYTIGTGGAYPMRISVRCDNEDWE